MQADLQWEPIWNAISLLPPALALEPSKEAVVFHRSPGVLGPSAKASAGSPELPRKRWRLGDLQ